MAPNAHPRFAEAVAAALICLFPLQALADEADPDAGVPAAVPEPAAPSSGPAAPDEAGLESLLAEPVVSAASRTAESTSDAPGTTWTITGTDLKRYGIQSVEEAIRFLGHGMTSYEYDDRLNAAFGARGYLSDNIGLHLAVLIDGNQAGGSAKTARGTQQYMMPIELVDHIEIVLGPGSVIYGNSAMLGVVNVVTRSAASLEGKTTVVGQVSAGTPADRWARDTSWGEVWGRAAAYGGQTFQLRGKPFELAWHFALRWDRQEGRSVWRPRSGVDEYLDPTTGFTREDVFNRDLHTRLFARATWGKWTFLSTVAFGLTSGTGPIESSGNSTASEPEYMLDATWQDHVGSRGDLSLRAYMVVFDSKATLVPVTIDGPHCLATVGVTPCFDTLHYVNFRPFIEPIFAWDWKQDGTQVTTLGAQLFIDGSVITAGTITPDGSKKDFDDPIIAPLPNGALYVQHIWRAGFGTINAGVRGDVGILGSAVSPRLAFSTSPWRNGTVKAVISTGFRTPSITERYLEIKDFVTSNPQIGPEHVYSAELDLSQRLGVDHLQLAVFAALWDGMITTRNVVVNGGRISQFANLRNVWSAGVNVAWQGAAGPLDYTLSVNYAPGRVRLPPDIAQKTDQELSDARISRGALTRFGSSAFNSVFLPADGMPDFYATGRVSFAWGEGLPRLSVAANLNSPRIKVNYAGDLALLDPRNVEGPLLPWSIDVRGAVEQKVNDRVGLRLVVTGRSLNTVPTSVRIGDSVGPVPTGGVGASTNPVAPISAMAEVALRL